VKYLLDTNTCVEILRNRNPNVISRMKSQRLQDLVICSIVRAELVYGAHRSQHPVANLALIERFVAPLSKLPFDDDSADVYGVIRVELERAGHSIGPNDTIIAAIALSRNLTLVTHNTAEFSRVSGLVIDDWQL
jgi:tRNA(fMet)-specific endonuclease VapC